jgi:hypothetical protein
MARVDYPLTDICHGPPAQGARSSPYRTRCSLPVTRVCSEGPSARSVCARCYARASRSAQHTLASATQSRPGTASGGLHSLVSEPCAASLRVLPARARVGGCTREVPRQVPAWLGLTGSFCCSLTRAVTPVPARAAMAVMMAPQQGVMIMQHQQQGGYNTSGMPAPKNGAWSTDLLDCCASPGGLGAGTPPPPVSYRLTHACATTCTHRA